MSESPTLFPDLEPVQAIAELVMRLGEVERATQHPDGRPETDTTHTVMLALAASHLAPHMPMRLHMSTVVHMALIHDLVEAYAGDVDTSVPLDAKAQAAMDAAASEALWRIRKDLAGSPWVAGLIESYEAQEMPEARFVRYVDKIMPRLTNRANGCAPVIDRGRTRAQCAANEADHAAQLRRDYPEFVGLHKLFGDAGAAMMAAWGLKGSD